MDIQQSYNPGAGAMRNPYGQHLQHQVNDFYSHQRNGLSYPFSQFSNGSSTMPLSQSITHLASNYHMPVPSGREGKVYFIMQSFYLYNCKQQLVGTTRYVKFAAKLSKFFILFKFVTTFYIIRFS